LPSRADRLAKSPRRSPIAAPRGEPAAASAPGRTGRAFRLGPRAGAGAVLALALAAAVFGVALARHGSSATGPSGSATKRVESTARYGGIPTWLPKAKVPVDRILQASRAHPALAIEGDTVSIDLAGGRVLATAVGPSVPEEGRTPVPATSPCTFVVTFAAASAAIPLSATAFTFIDELGHVRHPRVTAIGGGPPPRKILPGRSQSLIVRDVLPTGDGGLAWAPAGGRPIASWDFDVEID
jgi:hypothetical protein